MIAFAMGFAKFAVIMLLATVFGVGFLIGGALLFVVVPLIRSEQKRLGTKRSSAIPTYQR